MSLRANVHPTESIVRSGRRMLAILVGMVHTRLNLLAVELMEEKSRIWLMLVLTALSLLFAFMALLMLSALVIVAFWDEHRMLAMGGLLGFYVAAAIAALLMLRQKARMGSKLFAGTLGELAKDSDALEREVEAQDLEFDFDPRRGHD
jgi:uncharacterized membrane protein YqjE